MGSTVLTGKTVKCADQTHCSSTDSTSCSAAITATYPCGSDSSISSSCDVCRVGQKICCVSKTQFSHTSAPKEVLGTCGAGEICINDGLIFSGNVCIKPCDTRYKPSCTNEKFEPKPVDVTIYIKECQASSKSAGYIGKYFVYPSDDNSCQRYQNFS